MNAISTIKDRARSAKRRVVLPEGTEIRSILAARKLVTDDIASVTLLGDETKIAKLAKENNLSQGKIEIINPLHAEDFNSYVQEYKEKREARGKAVSDQQAQEFIANTLGYGAMMVLHDRADASVAGAVNTTGDVLKAAIQIIGLKPGINTVSSSFMMIVPKLGDVHDKVLFFADCAVVPNPNAEQLASIAVSTAETMKFLLGETPRVAMLSFSTKGSASHADVDKVTEALKIVRREHPDLEIDGELQLDAAIIPEIGQRKAPDSTVAGNANVLIFPDLDSGNIGYKLTERLGGASATGPIIQGLAKPANDLSRGCSVDDIVNVSAIATLLKG